MRLHQAHRPCVPCIQFSPLAQSDITHVALIFCFCTLPALYKLSTPLEVIFLEVYQHGLAIGVDRGSAYYRAAANGHDVFYNEPSAVGVQKGKWVHGYEAVLHSANWNPKFLETVKDPEHELSNKIGEGPEGLSIHLPMGKVKRDWTIPELEARMFTGVQKEANDFVGCLPLTP